MPAVAGKMQEIKFVRWGRAMEALQPANRGRGFEGERL